MHRGKKGGGLSLRAKNSVVFSPLLLLGVLLAEEASGYNNEASSKGGQLGFRNEICLKEARGRAWLGGTQAGSEL